jgi:hypothetical protein
VSTFAQFFIAIFTSTKISLFSNKCDLESQRRVSGEEAQQYAEKHGAQYIETR